MRLPARAQGHVNFTQAARTFMKLARLLVTLSLTLSLFAPAAAAQETVVPAPSAAQAPADAAQAAQAERERQALKLLEEIGAEAAGLRLAENRVRAQAAVAELLWPHDEETAREILRGAQSSLAALAAAVATEDPRYQQHAQTAHNLRREIVLAVAARDPKLALELLRTTRVPPPPAQPGRDFYQPDAELGLETQLAELAAARDPKEALRMAEEGLAKGVSGNLPSVVERIRASDPQAATRLASDIVRRLRTTNLSTNYEAANVAMYLLRASRPPDVPQPVGGQGPLPNGSRAPAIYVGTAESGGQLVLDEQARRDLLTTLVNAALASNDAQRRGRPLLDMIQSVLPEIERLMPAQAATLRRQMGEGARASGQAQNPRERWAEYQQLMNTGTPEALVEAAAKAPAEMRSNLYRAAAFKAMNDGSPERARQIATQGITNPQEREQLLREIDQQQFWRASQRGDVEAARELLARVRSPEERLGLLLALAQAVAGREGQRDVAERLLEEVWGQVGGRARNHAQFGTQLQVAQIYAPFAPARAFEIVESCVEQLNELLAAAAVVDGFGQEAFEGGELKGDGGYIWTMLVQQSGEQLGQLASVDFDRAVSTADRFQRPEARLRARLSVARGVLARGAGQQSPRRRFGPQRRNSSAGFVNTPGRNVPQE